jgi:hypothetical protein
MTDNEKYVIIDAIIVVPDAAFKKTEKKNAGFYF